MPEELTRASTLFVGLCLCVLLWGGSVGVVYWDLRRRAMADGERRAWLGLVALLPVLGFLAYLLSRLFSLVFPSPSSGVVPGSAPKRITQLKPAPQAAPRTGTIAVADLVKETFVVRPTMPPPRIVVAIVAGPHAGDKFVLETLPAGVGRGGQAGLRLDRDQGVSRLHAEIYRRDGALWIRDLHSIHGTLVNGQSISDQALKIGDRIEVGRSTLVVTEEEP